ncbi:hypothetical protein VP01_1377g6 [Puccinia sorghi]|uniref:Uncharacterized protein n=1 Tax=Puccinia sorghi TaxID=27349 RepID=A0A0L6VLH2_9BASI|nr:hypothetical protein VP01_1377g6 [Puccinia sorghi]
MELEIDNQQKQHNRTLNNKRPPPTFEAAFSQARSQTNHVRVNYQQALINNNHSLLLLPPPPPPSTSEDNITENNLQSLEHFILNEQLDLPLHDPTSSFLTSLVHAEQPTSSSTELIFNPSSPKPPCSPQPPSPGTLLDHQASSPEGLYGSSPSNGNSPQQESPPSPVEPNSVDLVPPQNSFAPSRPPPLKLCLPPRSRRPPVIENSLTPFNSPAGSTPSTPIITTSAALRPTVSAPSNALKRNLNPSTFSHPTASKKQKINPLFMASSTHKSTHIPEIDKLKAWKQIQILRGAPRHPPESSTTGLSSKTAEVRGQLEGHSNAIQLVNEAQDYVDLIQKVQDALGEELVRVQLEESVLRHVRGIIADRLVKNQDWSHQHYHHS